jgi:selenophosphate synthetase-related protein
LANSQESRENKQAHQFHPDGKQESIINDSTASAGDQMGIAIDMDPKNPYQFRNTFNYTPKEDQELKKFQDTFKQDS